MQCEAVNKNGQRCKNEASRKNTLLGDIWLCTLHYNKARVRRKYIDAKERFEKHNKPDKPYALDIPDSSPIDVLQ